MIQQIVFFVYFQTVDTEATLSLDSLSYTPEFWLLGVLEAGTVVTKRFNASESLHYPFDRGNITKIRIHFQIVYSCLHSDICVLV